MAGKIKCTYDDCFRHFSTVEAMKKHKAKDPVHDFYCKRCDLDCTDDHELLLHQITSDKHVVCPICGREFQSDGGRNRHVEIEHVPKQDIACFGCQMKFERASAIMAHIERGECSIIRRQDFQRQRAEKQIIEDAAAAAIDPVAGATVISNAGAFATADNEMNLLDDERAYVNTDWQGRPQFDEEIEHNGPYSSPLEEHMSNLSANRFPPLGPQSRAPPSNQSYPINNHSATGQSRTEPRLRDPTPTGVWGNSTRSASHLFKSSPSSLNSYNHRSTITSLNHTAASINLLDSFDNNDLDTNDNTKPFRPTSRSSSLAPQNSTYSHSTTPNLDSRYPHRHVTTHTPLRATNNLPVSDLFDPVLNKYICPSQHCGQHFSSHEEFNKHILEPVHTSRPIACPSCFKKFNSTAACLAHIESGSRKCRVREKMDVDLVVRKVTAGMLAIDGLTEEGGVKFVAKRAEEW